MIDSGKLKGGVAVVLLLAVLAVFDGYSSYANNRVTGAYYIYGLQSGSTVQSESTAADCQFDLAAYPCMFGYANGKDFDGVVVVGDQADSSNVISSVDIIEGLKGYFSSVPLSAKLASELASPTAHKVISVGGACSNAVTADWLGNPADCTTGLKEGKAVIKLIRHANGQIGVIVMGYSAMDIRRAARVLANYKQWQDAGKLMGNEIIVTGTGVADGAIAVFESEKSFKPNAGGGLYAGLEYTCHDGTGGGIAQSTGNCVGYDEIRQDAELGCLGRCSSTGLLKCGVDNLKFTPCGATGKTALPVPSSATTPVNLTPGWNILGANALYGLESTECDKGKVDKTIYNWNPVKNDYDACKLDDNLNPGQCIEIVRAVWVYTILDEKCDMHSRLGVAPAYPISLVRGWNMLAVQPEWINRKVSDVVPKSGAASCLAGLTTLLLEVGCRLMKIPSSPTALL
ncbi:hypothetical protein HYU40_00935 [Candidatus Woesearchaeota archaeon]|nr:hypothetical protein [Candidatus Woesearchaeota archaeon]